MTTIPNADRQERRAEFRGVIIMAIPAVLTSSSRALMDVADYVIVTWMGAGDAQAALLPAELVMWTYIVIGLGFVSVVSTFAAQSLGRREFSHCSAYAWQSIYLAMFFGIVGVAVLPLTPSIIVWMGHEPAVQALERAYLDVALLTTAPTIAAYGLSSFFIGIHRPWVAMWSVVEANVINIIVSSVLVFGYFGVEPMGIVGLAWGTMAGVTYRAIRLTIALLMPSVAQKYGSRRTWRFSWTKMVDLLRIGGPCALQWFSDVIVWALFVIVLVGTKFGTAHLIATNTAWQYMRMSFMPAMGVGQALTALVGKSIGAGDPQRAIREARLAVLITLAYMIALSAIYLLAGKQLIGLFNDADEVVRIGGAIMICAAVFQLFDALGIIYSAALRGAGDTFVPSLVYVISSWIMIVGGGYCVATHWPHLGSLGPWMAASALIVVTGLFLLYRWHSRAWMSVDLFGKMKAKGVDDAETVAGEPSATKATCQGT